MTAGPLAGWPSFTDEELEAVQQLLSSGRINYWTGEEGRNFERDYAAYTNRKYAIALHNGTVALELALRAFKIGAGDEVITSPRSFIASASAVVMAGARPVFADVDPDTQNISPASIEGALTPRTRAIIAVHLGGWPCDMDEIMVLAEKHDLIVIEDCAQAHGATYKGKPVGSFGQSAAFSFCQDKIITTGGEGGMLVLDDADAWARAWAFKDHGKSYDAIYRRQHEMGFRWVHESFGTNWRMLEFQAVLGRIQLRRLRQMVAQRERNARILRGRLADLPALRVPWPGKDIQHAFYRFYAFVRPERLAEYWCRDRIMECIAERKIPVSVGSCPEIYLESAFKGTDLVPSRRLPIARELGETSLAFLVHPTLKESEMQFMAQEIAEVVEAATK